jgi:hypothetical protein
VISLGLEGNSNEGGRDLTIDAMKEVATRLTAKYPVSVHAARYDEGAYEVDGFMVWTGPVKTELGTEWHGPVLYVHVRQRQRRRRMRPFQRSHRAWVEVQSVAEAAAAVGRAARGEPNRRETAAEQLDG